MKPNFALDLSHDGISLSHRGKGGWTQVGRVALEDPDISTGLDLLRQTAVALEAGRMTTKVMIPESQILYTELSLAAPAPEEAAQGGTPAADRIRARLAGLTPYAPEELAFDWRPLPGGRVQLAVVARETLSEAESFARDHRFNPVCFSAHAKAGSFDDEAFFGPAASAAALLADTGAVERETAVAAASPEEPPAEIAAQALPAEPAPSDTPAARAAPAKESTAAPLADEAADAQAAAGSASGDGAAVTVAADATAPDAVAAPLLPETAAAPSKADSDATSVGGHAGVLQRESRAAEGGATPQSPVASLSGSEGASDTPAPLDDPRPEAAAPAATGPEGDPPVASEEASGPVADPVASATTGAGTQAVPGQETAAATEASAADETTAAAAAGAATPLPAPAEPSPADEQSPAGNPRHVESAPTEDAATEDAAEAAASPPATGIGAATPAADPGGLPAFASRRVAARGAPAAEDDSGHAPARGAGRRDERSAAPVLKVVPSGDAAKADAPAPPRDLPAVGGKGGGTDAGSGIPWLGAALSARRAARGTPKRPEAPSHAAPLVDGATAPATSAATDSVLRRLPPMPARLKSATAGKTAPRDLPGGNRAGRGGMPPLAAIGRSGRRAAVASAAAPAETLGVFGARKPPAARRSPLMVLVLTAILLAGLALVALWSTFWRDGPMVAGVDSGVDIAAVSPPPRGTLPDPAAPVVRPDSLTASGQSAGIAPGPADGGDPADGAVADGSQAALPPVEPIDAISADTAREADAPAIADATPAEDGIADLTAPPEDIASGLVDDEALADGEPDVLLDPVPDGGAAGADQPAEALAAAGPVADTPVLPDDPMTELVPTDKGAAARVAAQLLEELTPEVAQRRYATSGIWVMAPTPPADPGLDSVDDVQVAAIDTQIEGQDAVALPVPAPDGVFPSPPPPPAAGTRFDFDANGLVRATPEGALNPEGILIYQGRPPVVPAARPGSAAPPPAAGAAPAVDGAPAAPAIPRIRPKPRPDDLTELNEKAVLGGRTRTELAQLRPRERPAIIAALVEAAKAPDAPDTAQAALELAPATKQAVLVSLVPRARPANFARVVAAARPAPPPPAEKNGGTDSGTVIEADGEPVLVAAAMPKLPTKAAVAKTATVSNALNLSKVNLIGVYGSPSSRRALVRLANGKYQKVKIGDRIDGGQVAAIGEAELIYVKGGRQIKLAMPTKT